MTTKNISDLDLSDLLKILNESKIYIITTFLIIFGSIQTYIHFKDKNYESILVIKPHKIEIINRYSDIIGMHDLITNNNLLQYTQAGVVDGGNKRGRTGIEKVAVDDGGAPDSGKLRSGEVFEKFISKLDSKKPFITAYNSVIGKDINNDFQYRVKRNQNIFSNFFMQRPFEEDLNLPSYKLIINTTDIEKTDKIVSESIKNVNQEIRDEYYRYYKIIQERYVNEQKRTINSLLANYQTILSTELIKLTDTLDEMKETQKENINSLLNNYRDILTVELIKIGDDLINQKEELNLKKVKLDQQKKIDELKKEELNSLINEYKNTIKILTKKSLDSVSLYTLPKFETYVLLNRDLIELESKDYDEELKEREILIKKINLKLKDLEIIKSKFEKSIDNPDQFLFLENLKISSSSTEQNIKINQIARRIAYIINDKKIKETELQLKGIQQIKNNVQRIIEKFDDLKNLDNFNLNFIFNSSVDLNQKLKLDNISSQISNIIRDQLPINFLEAVEKFKNDDFLFVYTNTDLVFYKDTSNNKLIYVLGMFVFLLMSMAIMLINFSIKRD